MTIIIIIINISIIINIIIIVIIIIISSSSSRVSTEVTFGRVTFVPLGALRGPMKLHVLPDLIDWTPYYILLLVIMDSLRGSSVKIGTMQRKLAWPLRKDDTHKSRSVNNHTPIYNTTILVCNILV